MKDKDKKLVRSVIKELRGYEDSFDIDTITASDDERAIALEALLEEVEYIEEER